MIEVAAVEDPEKVTSPTLMDSEAPPAVELPRKFKLPKFDTVIVLSPALELLLKLIAPVLLINCTLTVVLEIPAPLKSSVLPPELSKVYEVVAPLN